MGFSRQEYWSELPFPPPGDLPNPGIEPMSPATSASAGRFFTYRATWEGHPQCPWPFLISDGSAGKNPPANAGDAGEVGSIPGLGRSPGGGNGNPLQYSSHGQRSLVGYSPWGFPGKNTGVGCHVLLQGIFPAQGWNQRLLCPLHW